MQNKKFFAQLRKELETEGIVSAELATKIGCTPNWMHVIMSKGTLGTDLHDKLVEMYPALKGLYETRLMRGRGHGGRRMIVKKAGKAPIAAREARRLPKAERDKPSQFEVFVMLLNVAKNKNVLEALEAALGAEMELAEVVRLCKSIGELNNG